MRLINTLTYFLTLLTSVLFAVILYLFPLFSVSDVLDIVEIVPAKYYAVSMRFVAF